VRALYVADASAVAALFLPDEGDHALRELFDSLGDAEIFIPTIFWYEIANVIKGAVRRDRLSEAEALSLWPQLQALGLRIDDRGGPGYGRELFQLAHSHGLSAYDAAYFELAARRAATLVSLDEELRRAAGGAGVALLPASLKR
jgi:predicted nucleic acid-binding protein